MTKSLMLALSVSATLCAAGALRADSTLAAANSAANAKPAAAAPAAAPAAASSTAAAVAKNDAPGSLKAGKDLLNAGKYADAVAYFNGIGEQVADHGKAKREPYRQLDLASAYLGLNQYSDAEQAASAALALMPDLEAAWNDLASAQVNEGNRDKAIATYKQGVAQLDKDSADHSRLDANLQALQAAAGDTADSDSDQSSAMASTPTAKAPAAAKASSPKANAAATVGN